MCGFGFALGGTRASSFRRCLDNCGIAFIAHVDIVGAIFTALGDFVILAFSDLFAVFAAAVVVITAVFVFVGGGTDDVIIDGGKSGGGGDLGTADEVVVAIGDLVYAYAVDS